MHHFRDRRSRRSRGVSALQLGLVLPDGVDRILIIAVTFCLLLLVIGGCSGPEQTEQATSESEVQPQDFYAVHIDRAAGSGAAVDSTDHPRHRRSREFVSAFAGVGRTNSDDRTTDGLAAAREAAIIEAFFNALIETRRSSGAETTDFTVDLSDRLQASLRVEQGARIMELRLVSRGAETLFRVHEGVLQHPAHDFELVLQLFAETEGRFSLLFTELLDSPRNYLASVGCYEPAGSIGAMAGVSQP